MADLTILNLDCFTSPAKRQDWLEKARGYKEQGGQGVFNGGLLNPQREHMRLGQYYYRFVGRATKPAYKVGGAWWFDFDTLNGMYQRFLKTGPNPNIGKSTGPASSTFREWLALPIGWNLMEEIVIARLEARLDCYSGFGRLAQGEDAADIRPFGYAPHLNNLFTIKQLCVPECWVHQPKAFPSPKIVPFDMLDQVMAGRVN